MRRGPGNFDQSSAVGFLFFPGSLAYRAAEQLKCETPDRVPHFVAWYSYTLGSTVPAGLITTGQGARKLLSSCGESQHLVHTASRRGALLQMLSRILDRSSIGRNLYLLQDEAVLTGTELERQADRIKTLLAEIDHDPQLVLDATRKRHEPSGIVSTNGFDALPFETIYPASAVIEDGWVYFHSKEQVRALIASAPSTSDPKPEFDDDGESLEYLFGFLKSHASLLRTASALGLAIAYAEMNPAA